MAYVPIQRRIVQLFKGEAKLRMATAKAVSIRNLFCISETLNAIFFLQGPVITDNGNFILDWLFPQDIIDWNEINKEITMIPGVVETGLFVNMVDRAIFAEPDNSIYERTC